MVYCTKCGTQNDDDAEFCKKCGASLHGGSGRREYRRERDDRCEEECAGGKGGRGWSLFWGVIIILFGLMIIFEVVLKNMATSYPGLAWVNSIQFGWIFAAVIGLFIIFWGARILSKH
ncbi:MAG: zinc-ribbon domain-containing protein [Methanobacteriota archaeon]